MRRNSRGTEAGRAWWWAVLRTERDRRLAAAGGWPITTPNLRRLLSRRLARVGEDWPLCETLGLHISSVLAAGKETELSDIDFEKHFKVLTGNDPLSWQIRLYEKWFAEGNLPPVIDLPTGLGKTMVMSIWLIARAQKSPKVPTRLIYVVDRRTVVDQATDLAEEFAYLLCANPAKNFAHVEKRRPELVERRQKHAESLDQLRAQLGQDLAISTLRGQLADNREWSRDPSKPAIIIGTVDLIGSALLFSGYRSSFKQRPLHAGLLGQDSLMVLDEAHLSKPFEKLICAINDEGPFQKKRDDKLHNKPMRVIRMSATSGNSTDVKPPFTLQFDAKGNLSGNDAKDLIINERFSAQKRLTIITLGEKEKSNDKLANAAIELAQKSDLRGKRIVVFVRRPDDARAISEAIKKHGETKAKPGAFSGSVEVLTGTMRGWERDKLVEKPVLKRFLNGNENPDLEENKQPVFLISTSAGVRCWTSRKPLGP